MTAVRSLTTARAQACKGRDSRCESECRMGSREEAVAAGERVGLSVEDVTGVAWRERARADGVTGKGECDDSGQRAALDRGRFD